MTYSQVSEHLDSELQKGAIVKVDIDARKLDTEESNIVAEDFGEKSRPAMIVESAKTSERN